MPGMHKFFIRISELLCLRRPGAQNQTTFSFAMFEADITIWPFFHSESVDDRRRYIIKVILELCVFIVIGFVHWILVLTLLQ